MLIPVDSGSGSAREWVIVELQGKVEASTDEAQLKSDIGVLLQGQKADALQLTVGYHQLEGKLLKLKKPLVIMEKVQTGNTQGDDSMKYEVVGVIRQKYLFKNRPRALISKPT